MANLPALTPTTFGEMMQFAEVLAQSTMIPPAYQKNPANIVLAIMYGREIGLGALQSVQNIAVINGKPALYGDAQLALVRASPLCEDVIERIELDDNKQITAAVCEARRKGAAPVIGRFTVNDARRAGLWDKAGPWKQYPRRMLQMRARGFALRDAFPDVLRGVISVEEAADMPRQARDVTPVQSVAGELDSFATATPPTQGTQGEIDLGLVSSEAEPDVEQAAAESDVEPVVTIEAIKPRRLGSRGGWDWPGYADAVIEAARELPREHFGAFRLTNASMMSSLRMARKEEWSRLQQALADLERGEEVD